MVGGTCRARGMGPAETAAVASSVGGGVASLTTQAVIVPVDVVGPALPPPPPPPLHPHAGAVRAEQGRGTLGAAAKQHAASAAFQSNARRKEGLHLGAARCSWRIKLRTAATHLRRLPRKAGLKPRTSPLNRKA